MTCKSEVNIIKRILKNEYGITAKKKSKVLTPNDIDNAWKAWLYDDKNKDLLCDFPKEVYCHIIAKKIVSNLEKQNKEKKHD